MRAFARANAAASLAEYAVLLGLLVVALVGVTSTFSGSVSALMERAATALSGASGTGTANGQGNNGGGKGNAGGSGHGRNPRPEQGPVGWASTRAVSGADVQP